jgi:hypothetical protein
MSVRFRVQFLDRSANIVREMYTFAWSVAYVTELLKAIEWPPVAVSLRILDPDDHEVDFMANRAAGAGYLAGFDRSRPSRHQGGRMH